MIALERARDLEPDKGSVRETLARAYFRTGRFTQAGEEFERAVEIEPVNDYAHFGLGLCLMRRGDRIGARRHLKLAVAMRPDQPDYRAALRARHRRRVSVSAAGRRLRSRRRGLAGRRAHRARRRRDRRAPRRRVVRGVRVEQLELAGGRRRRQARAHGRAGHRGRRRHQRDGRSVAARAVAGPRRARARVRRTGCPRGARIARLARGRRRPRRRGGRRLPPRVRLRRPRPGVGRGAGRRPVRRHQPRRHLSGPRRADPGAGSLVAAVATAAGRTPEVAGKPAGADRRPHPRALRHHRGRGGRPAVTERRWPPRSAGRSRWCSRGSPPRSRPRAARRSPTRRRRSWAPTSAPSPAGPDRVAAPATRAGLRYLSGVSCAGDCAPTTRRRARAPRIAREPPSGGGGDRGRTGPGRREPRHRRRPAGRRGRADPAHRRAAAVRVPRRGEAGAARWTGSGSTSRAVAPSTPARRPVASPTACCRRAPRTSTRSTSAAGSSRGRSAKTRAITVRGAHQRPPPRARPISAAPVDAHRRRPLVHLAGHRRPRAGPLHPARRRLRAPGEAAVRSRSGPHRQGRHRARPRRPPRGAARGARRPARRRPFVPTSMVSPLRGADGNVEFLVRCDLHGPALDDDPPRRR